MGGLFETRVIKIKDIETKDKIWKLDEIRNIKIESDTKSLEDTYRSIINAGNYVN